MLLLWLRFFLFNLKFFILLFWFQIGSWSWFLYFNNRTITFILFEMRFQWYRLERTSWRFTFRLDLYIIRHWFEKIFGIIFFNILIIHLVRRYFLDWSHYPCVFIHWFGLSNITSRIVIFIPNISQLLLKVLYFINSFVEFIKYE